MRLNSLEAESWRCLFACLHFWFCTVYLAFPQSFKMAKSLNLYIEFVTVTIFYFSCLGPWIQGISHVCQSCHLVLVKVRHVTPKNWFFFKVLLVLFGIFWVSKPGMDSTNKGFYWLMSFRCKEMCAKHTLSYLIFGWNWNSVFEFES